ncbi:MAG: hypothetical protein WC637_19920, partial [Victivallales bacterium]
MVAYLDSAKAAVLNQGIAYLGGEKGADILERLQAKFRRIESPDAVKQGEVLLLGDGLGPAKLALWKDQVSRFVRAGGVCLSLPRAKDEFNWLPFEVSVKESLVDSTLVDKPSQPLLAGLSNGELYYSGRIPVVALDKVPVGAFMPNTGILADIPFEKGRYVLCQISPDSFDCDARYYLEESRKHSYRMIQTLLNNIGAPMLAPLSLRSSAVASSTLGEALPPTDLTLSGSWTGLKSTAADTAIPVSSDSRWKPVKVPGYVGEQNKEWSDNKSFVFWYRCVFTVDKLSPESAP